MSVTPLELETVATKLGFAVLNCYSVRRYYETDKIMLSCKCSHIWTIVLTDMAKGCPLCKAPATVAVLDTAYNPKAINYQCAKGHLVTADTFACPVCVMVAWMAPHGKFELIEGQTYVGPKVPLRFACRNPGYEYQKATRLTKKRSTECGSHFTVSYDYLSRNNENPRVLRCANTHWATDTTPRNTILRALEVALKKPFTQYEGGAPEVCAVSADLMMAVTYCDPIALEWYSARGYTVHDVPRGNDRGHIVESCIKFLGDRCPMDYKTVLRMVEGLGDQCIALAAV